MDAIDSVIGYLKHKNAEERGYLKYGYYKKLICYILDLHLDYYTRKIFLKMFKKGYFIKSKNDKKVFKYRFNPNPEIEPIKEENDKRESITLTFE
tara:strand:- start:5307 stop:5591 length:285 start_codon:yes stop_codon:yes gene_type:complete